MGKATNTAAAERAPLGDGTGASKKRVNLRRKAAKKALSISAPSATASAAVTSSASDGRAPGAVGTAASLSREERKALIAAARARGLLPAARGTTAAGASHGRGREDVTGAKRVTAARAQNPNSRRRRGTRRAVVANGDEEGGAVSAFMTPAEERMAQVHEELDKFDAVVQAPEFVDDPFAAIARHLEANMTTLKPLTPDVGRLAEETE